MKIIKNAITILSASLVVAMFLPFNGMNVIEAQTDDRNARDKTLERIQEKNYRELILKEIIALTAEKEDLKNKSQSASGNDEKQHIDARIDEIKSELNEIDKKNHMRDIPQAQLERLIKQQDSFEEKLLRTDLVKFVTSIGIDITSQEIQVGVDRDIVNSGNIDVLVAEFERMMPENAKWHVVYSDRVEFLSCNQIECDPIIGGNYIKVDGMDSCSFGFQAKKDSVLGWITAGHCADGKVGSLARDASNDIIGAVNVEKFYWGTYCDCAWLTVVPTTLVDNKVYSGGIFTITKTTSASNQQNDTILKSGYAGEVDEGVVSALHVTVIDFLNEYYVRDLVRSDTPMEHGDSGGTIIEKKDQSDLYGIATAHDWWGRYHTPIDRIITEMSVTPILN